MTSFFQSGPASAVPPAESPIQLFWQRFHARYKGKPDYIEALYQKVNDARKVSCPKCGGQHIARSYGSRMGRCRNCRKMVSFTAGTFLSGIRREIAWLAAFELFESGIAFNASDLHRGTGTSISTAWVVIKCISMVLNHLLNKESLAIEEPSASFCETFFRRSLATPANEHPKAEQAEIEKHEPTNLPTDTVINTGGLAHETTQTTANEIDSQDDKPQLSEKEEQVLGCLSLEPLPINDLCNRVALSVPQVLSLLGMLELDDLVRRLPGDRYIKLDMTPEGKQNSNQTTNLQSLALPTASGSTTPDSDDRVKTLIQFLRSVFQGISRKYLQLYLASYWCQTDRSRWSTGLLLKACLRFKITYENVRGFVSPAIVQHMPI